MSDQTQEKHQLAGVDARERGFSRPVDRGTESGIHRVARDTPVAALEELIRTLQGQGYSQLRSQLSIKEGTYLGSQEPWIEYPDLERPSETPDGLISKLFGWMRRSTS